MEGGQTLFVQDDTGNYVEYTPPEPPGFQDTLPEDLRGSEHLKDVEDNAQLARYYVDLKSNYLKPPDNPDGYEFDMPDGFELDGETFGGFKKVAFEHGLNQKQFAEIMNFEVNRHNSAMESIKRDIEARRTEAETALKTEWGESYEQKLDAAKRVLNHESLSDPGFKEFLEETRFGDNPQVVKFFARLSDLISEDAFIKTGTGDGEGGPRKDEAGRPMLRFPTMENRS
jgi:hypothetical protein